MEKGIAEEPKTPTRAEIPEDDKWDLSHLFSDIGKWSEDLAWITRTYPEIARWKGRVSKSAKTLAQLLEFEKELDLKIERSEEHTSELQSLRHLVCRLLLEKKKEN